MERTDAPRLRRFATDAVSLRRATEIETYTGGGPGGQHRNKTQTAVRLRHRPSGLVVTATERRSQAENLRVAFERLAARLERLNRPRRPRVPTRATAGSKQRRLAEKTRAGEKKRRRRRPGSEE